ncbi:MAG TPA: hypothetical protein VKW06_00695 [Candidatus Angelobacter sp.]|nr:hypothetical protein [Candidatus Angelobacter sp.]
MAGKYSNWSEAHAEAGRVRRLFFVGLVAFALVVAGVYGYSIWSAIEGLAGKIR